MNFLDVYEHTKQLTLLYVEDDKNFQNSIIEILERLFKSVDTADNGVEGIKKYRDFHETTGCHYDLVITDVNMPDMDGVALSKEIYTINISQPIIVVSAHNNIDNLMEFVNIGIEQFITKPLQIEKMLEVLSNTSQKIVAKKQNTITCLSTIEIYPELIWDSQTFELRYQNNIIPLTKREMQLLELFIANDSKPTQLKDIYNQLWENPDEASLELLKPIISRFRKKLPHVKIKNVYGVGYRLEY